MDTSNNQNTSNPNPVVEPESILPPKHNTLMAAISYIGPLVIISYLMARDDTFVKFHIREGAALFVIEIVIWVLSSFLWVLWPILWIVHILLIAWSVVGIVNAVRGKEKQLPITGRLASKLKI